MISKSDFQAAKKEVKKIGTADPSKAHRIAIETLRKLNPNASEKLIGDMGWQVVLSAR